MTVIENCSFDEERAFYGEKGITVKHCAFDGPADGESAFKECSDINAEDCFFNLRYPFWHDRGVKIIGSEMTENCRAALWYSEHITVRETKMHGIKALRECDGVIINDCDILSPEFGWSARNIQMSDCSAVSEYFLLRAENILLNNVRFSGKYSFQYIKNALIENCELTTKDAFWHAENVTVKNCVLNGEYLGWYSNGLTLINCKITGTQPLCYCKNLKLVDCEMFNTDLSFEKSEVEAEIITPIVSVKNPAAGIISAPAFGEIISDDPKATGETAITERDLYKAAT